MADLRDRLQAALGDAYRLERELGGGGMSRVFVAQEIELGRQVVVKVLPPEMAAGVNADRFRREIQLAASLQHPHIVPLLHAGRDGDLVWYTMPLIEGESLRAKLAREGELPISEAVRILRDVVDALAYAHAHQVVHRDIKPDNVLLSARHAVVTDFGVAKAISESTGATSLTSIGVALGTPAYMAPEQAAAENVDHRADIYSVGALAYELLTGRPPFTGSNAQQVLAAHVTQAPDPMIKHRPSVPPALAALVMRCLEKKPADRWQHAGELHAQLEGMATPSGGTIPTTATAAVARPRNVKVAALAGGLIAVVAGAFFVLKGGGGPGIDANLVAVLPFRVAGADPSLHYLREGMIDLLAAKLTGEGGPRAADPRTVTAAFHRAGGDDARDLSQEHAVTMARDIGAGQALLGALVGSPAHVTMSATLVGVPGGATRAQASVEGPADSLPLLVDRLAAQLLIRGAVGAQGEASVGSRSLAALQAYLAGQKAYRQGDYRDAAALLERAVGLDSTFTLAAWGALLTNGWGAPLTNLPRLRQLAWDGREQLSPANRAMIEAYLGPKYPAPPLQAELLRAREDVVARYPDVADAWYYLGDKYLHEGRRLGYNDWAQRSLAAFERAIAIDSAFAGALSHLINAAAEVGDTARVRRYDRMYRTLNPGTGAYDHVVRWDVARTLRDAESQRRFWTGFDTAANRAGSLPAFLTALGGKPAEIDSTLAILARRASTDAARGDYHREQIVWLFNSGRPRAAAAVLDSAPPEAGPVIDELRVVSALFWEADTVAAIQAERRLAPFVSGPPPPPGPARFGYFQSLCTLTQWRLARGDATGLSQALQRLRSSAPPHDQPGPMRARAVCAAIAEAAAATLARRPEARRLVESIDSLVALGPNAMSWPFDNLVIGRLFETLGDPARGLRAVRRGAPSGFDFFVSTYLRDTGRLAALAGDRETAIRAYERYLELRPNPEAEVKAQVDQVRAELAKLVGESGN